MTRLNPIPRLWRGGLATRLFVTFLFATLLPLALSDWISSAAVTQIAESLSLEHRALATRQVSRQVFDRLMAGKMLVTATQAMEPSLAGSSGGARPGAPSKFGTVFRELVRAPTDDSASPLTGDAAAEMLRAWQAAAHRVARRAPPKPGDHDRVTVQIRIHAPAGAPARVLLGVLRQGKLDWIAEFDPAYLWAPVMDAGDDSEWSVAEASGSILVHRRGTDFETDAARASADAVESRTQLFLGGEFAASDWVFVQRFERPQVLWHGQRLTVWLALFAIGTLLVAALLGGRQINRAIAPLQRLTEGTRQLAAGATDTRVTVWRDDEIGVLAGAFNDMAARIETQFGSMQGLAGIDRAILAGMPFSRLAELTLAQLTSHYPHTLASVYWRASATSLNRLRVEPVDGDVRAVAAKSDALAGGHVDVLPALVQDEQWMRPASSDGRRGSQTEVQRWFFADSASTVTRLVLLPLRQQGRTEAVVALAFAAVDEVTAEQLQPARALRDRLAVAMATRAREQELVHRAAHDSLTGLVNRYGLNDNLDALLAAGEAFGPLAILLLDLDHFKDVNDSRGHDVGDELLRLVSDRLTDIVPPGTLVARQGGDEFVLVAKGAGDAEARRIAAHVMRVLGEPFSLRGVECVLGVSVGVALCPDNGRDRDELLRCADVALYAAKAAGRGRCSHFTVALDTAASERVRLIADMHHALEGGEFVVHYQPRVTPGDGAITSAEALIRWQHPERGLLFPDSFIAQAESCGLIDAIGVWILGAACAQMAAWRQQGVHLDRLSVNVSPQQLISGRLLEHVRDALERHGLPADALELEVTESLLVGDVASACAQLAELRSWGVSIALDDFGTGYSSMSTLHQLPIDVIKIDRSFVQRLGVDDAAIAVVRAIVSLARSLRLHLVAEGIETEAQVELLRTLRCDELQGYLYSRPVSARAFVELRGLVRVAESSGEQAHCACERGGPGGFQDRASVPAPLPT